MKASHVIWLFVGLFISFVLGYRVKGIVRNRIVARMDTIIVVDTIRDSIPFLVKEVVTKHIALPPDTVVKYTKSDTVFLPMIQKEYLTDNYHAWVSGYNSALDSITLFPKTVYVTRKVPDRHWGVAVTGGYGITRSGLSSYIGLGVYYRIW